VPGGVVRSGRCHGDAFSLAERARAGTGAGECVRREGGNSSLLPGTDSDRQARADDPASVAARPIPLVRPERKKTQPGKGRRRIVVI
jgi:hypothetical protein